MNLFLFLLHGLILFSLLRFIVRKTTNPSLQMHLWFSAALKIAAGIALGWVYKLYYLSGDTYVFHQEGLNLANFAVEQPWKYVQYLIGLGSLPVESEYLRMPRVLFQAKIVSVAHLVTGGNYWLSACYFSFFSWWGMWTLAEKVIRNYPGVRNAALLSCLYIPSFVFWGSGMTKESLAIGAFGFIVAFFVPVIRWKITSVLFLIVMLLLLWNVKYYYVVPLALALCLPFIWDFLGEKWGYGWAVKLLIVPVMACLLFAGVSGLNPNFDWSYFPEMVFANYQAFADKSQPGTYVVYHDMCGAWRCLFTHFPQAVYAALYRPMPWETFRVFQGMVSIEHSILFLLTIGFFLRIRSMRYYSHFVQHRIVAALVFIVFLAGFLGLAAPNFGTLQRYGAIMVPVLYFLGTADSELFRRLTDRLARIRLPLRHG